MFKSQTYTRWIIRITFATFLAAVLIGFCAVLPAQSEPQNKAVSPKVLALVKKANQLTLSEKTALISLLTKEAKPEAVELSKSGPYTSLIVDARGLNIRRSISPKIRKADGTEVWGTLDVTPTYAIETGVASFVTNMQSAQECSRRGDNPLIVKANGAYIWKGNRSPIVSDKDAALIKEENAKTKFGDKCKVIFVIDK